MNNYERIKTMSKEDMATMCFFSFGTKGKDGTPKAYVVGLDGLCYTSAEQVYQANLDYLNREAGTSTNPGEILSALDKSLEAIKSV